MVRSKEGIRGAHGGQESLKLIQVSELFTITGLISFEPNFCKSFLVPNGKESTSMLTMSGQRYQGSICKWVSDLSRDIRRVYLDILPAHWRNQSPPAKQKICFYYLFSQECISMVSWFSCFSSLEIYLISTYYHCNHHYIVIIIKPDQVNYCQFTNTISKQQHHLPTP